MLIPLCQCRILFPIWFSFFVISTVFFLFNIDESVGRKKSFPGRFRRGLSNAFEAHPLKLSRAQQEAKLFRKLLKHPKVMEMCGNFEQPMEGDEGRQLFNSNEFRLVQVHVFVSPGQTIPEKEIPALRLPSISCKFSRLLSDHPKVRRFQETIYMFQNLQQGHNTFKVFPPNPRKRICNQKDLTPFGSLQLIRNGEFLSQVYTKYTTNTHKASLASFVHVQSLPAKLQYQSALAFSHGFLNRDEFTRLTVEKSLPNFAPRSMNAALDCPRLDRHSLLFEDAVNSGKFIFKRGHPSTRKLARLFNSQHVTKSSALELLSRVLLYFCNHLSPSCFDAPLGVQCLNVTNIGLDAAFNMADTYMQSIAADPMFQEISILSTFPALKHLVERIVSTDNSPFFQIYSGKYSFLTYLLRALHVRITSVPPAASRLVLEVYNHISDDSRFFRLLFNGKDVTANVLSCKALDDQFYGMCPFSVLKQYVGHVLFSKFNSETYKQACI